MIYGTLLISLGCRCVLSVLKDILFKGASVDLDTLFLPKYVNLDFFVCRNEALRLFSRIFLVSNLSDSLRVLLHKFRGGLGQLRETHRVSPRASGALAIMQ